MLVSVKRKCIFYRDRHLQCICIKGTRILTSRVSLRAAMKLSAFSSDLRCWDAGITFRCPCSLWRMGVVVFVLGVFFLWTTFPRGLLFRQAGPVLPRSGSTMTGECSALWAIAPVSLGGSGSVSPRQCHSTRDAWQPLRCGSPFAFLACSRL